MDIQEVGHRKKIAGAAAVSVFAGLLVLAGYSFTEGSIIGAGTTFELDSCNNIYVQDDRYNAETCNVDGDLSSFSGGGKLAIYPYGISELETGDQANPDLYGYFAKYLVAAETSLEPYQIETGPACKTQFVYEPYICSQDPESMKQVLDNYGVSYNVWDNPERIDSSYNEILSIESYQELGEAFEDYGSCEADLVGGSVEGETVYGEDLRYGEMGCIFRETDKADWGSSGTVSFSFDLTRTDYVTGWEKVSDLPLNCEERRYEEGSEPMEFFDSEQECLENYRVSGDVEVDGPRNVTVGESVEYTVQTPDSDSISVSWSNGESGESATYSWDSTGEKTVEVTVDNGVSEKSESIVVNVEDRSFLESVYGIFGKIWSIITFSG